jgi:hypothetical protein
MYMSDIGRWGVVDPLTELTMQWSPFAYAYNNPIRYIDPDGMYAGESDPVKEKAEQRYAEQEAVRGMSDTERFLYAKEVAASKGDSYKVQKGKEFGTDVYMGGKLVSHNVEGHNYSLTQRRTQRGGSKGFWSGLLDEITSLRVEASYSVGVGPAIGTKGFEVNLATAELLGGSTSLKDGKISKDFNTLFDRKKITQGVSILGFGVERTQGNVPSELRNKEIIGLYSQETDRNGKLTNHTFELPIKVSFILSLEFVLKFSQN